MKYIAYTVLAFMTAVSTATAGVSPPTPTNMPEPGTFGMFALGLAAAIIVARFWGKK